MSFSDVMTKIQMAEKTSDAEKMYTYKGVLYPRLMCPEENLKAVETMEAREDDIMLVAYPKCGFNWMVGVLNKIMAEAGVQKIETESKVAPLIEFFGPDKLKIVNEAPSPRFMGTHLHPDNIPASFYEKKTKMLVIFRNPKDTLVSYFHFSNNNPVLPSGQSFDSYFSQFMSGDVGWGSYFDHAVAWDKKMDDPNVMIVTYEALKQNLTEGVRQISTFFGFKLTEDQIQQVSGQSTFNAMKQSSADTHGNLGNIFFRKGVVGDWKNNFTPEQSREMDEVFNKRLAGTRLGAKLNYQQYCQ
ncbi:sulfotransferase 6B1 isoform X2 [Acanthochromis polyacanthus]|nr:sulfotransferase 6B1 isoform X2 [Acanthochromis polyacanthus]XP_051815625.1 sulfotransferase 6B1 isoform X2 [Acanthochromis polyacanthus]